MEAKASGMKTPTCTGGRPLPAIASGFASIAGALLLLTCFSFQNKSLGTTASADQSSPANTGYVGSRVCSKCHPSIYESFSRTDMGRSMLEITPALLERIPTSANIFDPEFVAKYYEAVDIVNNWRASHSYPLQTIKMTLKRRAKRVCPTALVAQRLKRLASIKLKLNLSWNGSLVRARMAVAAS